MHSSTNYSTVVVVVVIEPLVEGLYLRSSFLSSLILSPSSSLSCLAFPVLSNRAYEHSSDPLIFSAFCSSSGGSGGSSSIFVYTLEWRSRFKCP
jgi:hypothetical protein